MFIFGAHKKASLQKLSAALVLLQSENPSAMNNVFQTRASSIHAKKSLFIGETIILCVYQFPPQRLVKKLV